MGLMDSCGINLIKGDVKITSLFAEGVDAGRAATEHIQKLRSRFSENVAGQGSLKRRIVDTGDSVGDLLKCVYGIYARQFASIEPEPFQRLSGRRGLKGRLAEILVQLVKRY